MARIKIKVTTSIALPPGNPIYMVQCADPMCSRYREFVPGWVFSGQVFGLSSACIAGAGHLRRVHPNAYRNIVARQGIKADQALLKSLQ